MRRHPLSITCLEDSLELVVHFFSPVVIPHKLLIASVTPLHKCDQTDFFQVADKPEITQKKCVFPYYLQIPPEEPIIPALSSMFGRSFAVRAPNANMAL